MVSLKIFTSGKSHYRPQPGRHVYQSDPCFHYDNGDQFPGGALVSVSSGWCHIDQYEYFSGAAEVKHKDISVASYAYPLRYTVRKSGFGGEQISESPGCMTQTEADDPGQSQEYFHTKVAVLFH